MSQCVSPTHNSPTTPAGATNSAHFMYGHHSGQASPAQLVAFGWNEEASGEHVQTNSSNSLDDSSISGGGWTFIQQPPLSRTPTPLQSANNTTVSTLSPNSTINHPTTLLSPSPHHATAYLPIRVRTQPLPTNKDVSMDSDSTMDEKDESTNAEVLKSQPPPESSLQMEDVDPSPTITDLFSPSPATVAQPNTAPPPLLSPPVRAEIFTPPLAIRRSPFINAQENSNMEVIRESSFFAATLPIAPQMQSMRSESIPRASGPPVGLPPLPSWCSLPSPENSSTKRMKITNLSSPNTSRAPTIRSNCSSIEEHPILEESSPDQPMNEYTRAASDQSHSPSSDSPPSFYWELQCISISTPPPPDSDGLSPTRTTSEVEIPEPAIPLWSKPSWLIGRHTSCDHIIDHATISRHHARLMLHGQTGQLYLQDLNSTHGTFIDGKRISSMARSSSMNLDSSPVSSPTTIGAMALSKGANITFGACPRVYRVWQYEEMPVPATEEEQFTDTGSCTISSATSPIHQQQTHEHHPHQPVQFLFVTPPTMRKAVSDGQLSLSPGGVHSTADMIDTSLLVPQLPMRRLTSSLSSSNLRNIHRKRKSVSFATTTKVKDGGTNLIDADSLNGSKSVTSTAVSCDFDQPMSLVTHDTAAADDDDEEDHRPKRQGFSAEEITRTRKMILEAMSVPVPILKLPIFPFSRSSSAPPVNPITGGGGLPPPCGPPKRAQTGLTDPTPAALSVSTTGSPSIVATVPHLLGTFPLSSPPPHHRHHSSSTPSTTISLTPYTGSPDPCSNTAAPPVLFTHHTSSTFSPSPPIPVPTSTPSPGPRLRHKRSFGEDIPLASLLSASPSSSLSTSSAASAGSTMSANLFINSAPTTSGSSLSSISLSISLSPYSSTSVAMDDPTSNEDYERLLPQPLNSPASASSFTSLSLISHSLHSTSSVPELGSPLRHPFSPVTRACPILSPSNGNKFLQHTPFALTPLTTEGTNTNTPNAGYHTYTTAQSNQDEAMN